MSSGKKRPFCILRRQFLHFYFLKRFRPLWYRFHFCSLIVFFLYTSFVLSFSRQILYTDILRIISYYILSAGGYSPASPPFPVCFPRCAAQSARLLPTFIPSPFLRETGIFRQMRHAPQAVGCCWRSVPCIAFFSPDEAAAGRQAIRACTSAQIIRNYSSGIQCMVPSRMTLQPTGKQAHQEANAEEITDDIAISHQQGRNAQESSQRHRQLG